MDPTVLTVHLGLLAALVWSITEVLKQQLRGLQPPFIALIVAALVLAVDAYVPGAGDLLESAGRLLSVVLGAMGISNLGLLRTGTPASNGGSN